MFFFFSGYAAPLLLLSFPTRRSSDLRVREERRAPVTGTGQVDHVCIDVPDEAVQVDVDEAQARGRPPVAEEPGLHVLGPQRLTEKRVLLEVYLPDGEIVRGTPVGVEGEERVVRHEHLLQRRARARASVSRAAA